MFRSVFRVGIPLGLGLFVGFLFGSEGGIARAELSPALTAAAMATASGAETTAWEYEMVKTKPVSRHAEELAGLLEERGRDGWRLAAVTQISDYAIFERAKR